MKKIIILVISIFLLCGCNNEQNNQDYYIYLDKDTCIEYFVSNGPYSKGIVNPRYDTSGKVYINTQCALENANKRIKQNN